MAEETPRGITLQLSPEGRMRLSWKKGMEMRAHSRGQERARDEVHSFQLSSSVQRGMGWNEACKRAITGSQIHANHIKEFWTSSGKGWVTIEEFVCQDDVQYVFWKNSSGCSAKREFERSRIKMNMSFRSLLSYSDKEDGSSSQASTIRSFPLLTLLFFPTPSLVIIP